MNNIRDEHVSPDIPNPIGAFSIISCMLIIGFIAAGLRPVADAAGKGRRISFGISKWIVLPLVIAATVLMLKMIPGQVGQNLTRQYKIFGDKHTWAMTVIYTMTLGPSSAIRRHLPGDQGGCSVSSTSWLTVS